MTSRLRALRGSAWTVPALKVTLVAVGLCGLARLGAGQRAEAASLATDPTTSAATLTSAELDAGPAPLLTYVRTIELDDAAPPPVSPIAATAATSTVHLNTANQADLEKLPGIGPKKAVAILALRTKLGRFHAVEDLLRVKGIGRKRLAKLRPLVVLED